MERDFLGLNSKEPLAAVKRELSDDEVQWWWMNKASSFPPFSSFGAGPGASQDDGMNERNVAESITRQQCEGVGKVVTPAGRDVGFTEPRKHFKPCAAPPPQMTIFYDGTVSVYEGISPEKAQALMLFLASVDCG